MSESVLSDLHYHDEEAAYAFVEVRVWPEGRVCPHCGTVGHSGKLAGKSTRIGVYKCYDCRQPFTVKVGTIFEASHIKLYVWLQAMFLMSSSKKGVSANQLHRTLGITVKSAWFLAHRIREAMMDTSRSPLGGEGKVIEADETYFGGKQRVVSKKTGRIFGRQGPGGKAKVVALVERGGKARSFKVDYVNAPTISKILLENASTKSALMTDEAGVYPSIGLQFANHEAVMHSAEEYVRGNVHTNTIEGFFSIFKRGMRGIYQHCSVLSESRRSEARNNIS
jgi:transposase-like protein